MTIGSKMDLLDQLDQHLVPVERYLMETPKFPKLSLFIIITQDGGSEAFLPQPTASPGQHRR